MGVVMYVFAPEMIGVLSPVESIRELGTICLRIEAFAEPFFAASIVTYCVCVGAGDTKKPAAINLGTMWLVRLTLAYGLSQELWIGGRMDSNGYGTYLPRHPLPYPPLQRFMDEESSCRLGLFNVSFMLRFAGIWKDNLPKCLQIFFIFM